MRVGSNVGGVWVEEYDTDAQTYTRRDGAGTVLAQRAFTAAESAELGAIDTEATVRAALVSTQFDAVRAIARGSGTFASDVVRDAAIRANARAVVALARLALRRFDAVD